MSTQLDDWEALGAEWRGGAPGVEASAAVDALRQRVARHGRRQRLLLASEIVVSLGWLAAVPWYWSRPGARGVFAAAMIVVMLVLVWSFVIWNRRGSWRPLGASTREYVRLTHVRAQAGRRTVLFVRVVLGLSLAGYLPWFLLRLNRGEVQREEWWAWVGFAVYATAFLAGCAWYSRRIDRELAALREVERELEGEGVRANDS